MARRKLRPQNEVVERCRALSEELREALGRLPVRRSRRRRRRLARRGLGTLLWALQLAELPAYDQPFDADALARRVARRGATCATPRRSSSSASRRGSGTGARARPSLQAAGDVELPERFASFDQLIAATAMRGFEQGLLPAPMRGDFRAYGKVYRHLAPEQHAEAHSIALERHHALNWLCGARRVVGRRPPRHLILESLLSPAWNASIATPT